MGVFRRVAAGARRQLASGVRRVGGATRRDIEELRSELQELNASAETRLDSLGAQVEWLDRARGVGVERLDSLDAQVEWLDRARGVGVERLDSLDAQVEWLDRARGVSAERIDSLEQLMALDAVTRFVRHATLRSEPLVSVVLPTYDRPDRLGRAIASVTDQRYGRWELLVVDDGGKRNSRAVVESFGDERIRWTRIEHRGPCAARNHGLGAAEGDLIAYVDDDNVMDPDWLYAVVWAFEQRPDTDVLYGAFVIDDQARVADSTASGQLPRAILHPFSRDALRRSNLADTGAIAHRAGLPAAWWDESLREMGDWDLLLRLTSDRDPVVLPVIACYYMSDAPHRVTNGPTHAADLAKILGRVAVSP